MNKLPILAIFLGSFLAFFIQPVVGRTLLPIFGGTSAVWVTCLAIFQSLLLAGYGYAFIPSRSHSTAARIHIALLLLAAITVILFYCFRQAFFTLAVGINPFAGVTLCVLAGVGFAYVVLAANSTVVQSWTAGGQEVYRLYAVSNIGSFCGLLLYPFLIEPFLPLSIQWGGIATGLALYAILLARVRTHAHGATGANDTPPPESEEANSFVAGPPRYAILWFVLPLLSCALLTAITTHLTTDFVPLPLLWAILLAAFLLSYVIGFSHIGEYFLIVWALVSAPVILFAAWALLPCNESLYHFYLALGSAAGLLLIVCTTLHAWLCRIRPHREHLALFYFLGAAGGATGGILAGIIAPFVFSSILEYPLALSLSGAAIAWMIYYWRHPEAGGLNTTALVLIGLALAITAFTVQTNEEKEGKTLWQQRSFYGVVSVREDAVKLSNGGKLCKHDLYNGMTLHGFQVREDDYFQKPTMYYSITGGGIAFENHPARAEKRPLRAAIIGMGIGTLAAYGKPGDVFRFYEINPDVIAAATNTTYFSFIAESKATIEIIEADARLALSNDQQAGIEKFDILVVDAYNGDAIPVHLITAEAFQLYRSLLKDDGILALHITNWHINLTPIMKAAAKHLKMSLLGTFSGYVINEFASATAWAFLTNAPFTPTMPFCCKHIDWDRIPDQRLLTDARGSLLFNIAFGFVPPIKEDAATE